jgi:3-oxoacyl-[acyl-carrier-protein] synthase III
VDWLVMHQANQRILDAAAQRLGMPADRVVRTGRGLGEKAGCVAIGMDSFVFARNLGRAEFRLQRLGCGTPLPPAPLDLFFVRNQSRVQVSNLSEYGNTSAASIPLALDEAVRGGRIRDGDVLALAGFGAGLTWAGAIVRWGK